jgi:hypothetical protein
MLFNRRHVLVSLGFSVAITRPALAMPACGAASEDTPPDKVIGIDIPAGARFKSQAKTNWCWAASISTIFETNGVKVGQEKLVRTMFCTTEDSDAPNSAASSGPIFYALDRYWVDDNGQPFYSHVTPVVDGPKRSANEDPREVLFHALEEKKQCIFGSEGHATVAHKITVRNGKPTLWLWDPWPRNDRFLPPEGNQLLSEACGSRPALDHEMLNASLLAVISFRKPTSEIDKQLFASLAQKREERDQKQCAGLRRYSHVQ